MLNSKDEDELIDMEERLRRRAPRDKSVDQYRREQLEEQRRPVDGMDLDYGVPMDELRD
jgi:hypothetical protein